jgi:hypothetical protein
LIFLKIANHKVGVKDGGGRAGHHKGLKFSVSQSLTREELVKGFGMRDEIPPGINDQILT